MRPHLKPQHPALAPAEPAIPSLPEMPAVILAGGLGTRLRVAYHSGPKCLAPIAGRPFLQYLLRVLSSAGIRDFILCTGYKQDQIQRWLESPEHSTWRIRYSPERSPLGTGGALKRAQPLVCTEHFLCMNGDSLLEVDLERMYRFHLEHGAVATIALANDPGSGRFGSVRLNSDGKILSFAEKSADGPAGLVNGGLYFMRRDFLDVITAGEPVSLEREVFPKLAGSGLYGFQSRGYFIDIGIPADLERARSEFPKRFA